MAAVEGCCEVSQLPRARFWDAIDICEWESGSWLEPGLVKGAMDFQKTFEAGDDDVLLASQPKAGTTWIKALCLSILESDDALIKDSLHSNIQTIESMVYATKPHQDLYTAPSPRLFHTHLPYKLLPDSIRGSRSGCKIVYLARNPKDTVLSQWHFFNSIFRPGQDPFPLHKAVDSFCSGVHNYGPFFEHVLDFWEESRKNPVKILFLKYEDLKEQPGVEVKKLAEFLGKPFASDSEMDELLQRCSLERLRNLDVNKKGSSFYQVPNTSYFRRGVVGDWKNFLTPEMEQQIDETARAKFQGSGLHFDD